MSRSAHNQFRHPLHGYSSLSKERQKLYLRLCLQNSILLQHIRQQIGQEVTGLASVSGEGKEYLLYGEQTEPMIGTA